MDELIVFRPLSLGQITAILDLLIDGVWRALRAQGITLRVTDLARDRLSREAYDPRYGARPLRRTIQRLVADLLAEDILRGNWAMPSAFDAAATSMIPPGVRMPARSTFRLLSVVNVMPRIFKGWLFMTFTASGRIRHECDRSSLGSAALIVRGRTQIASPGIASGKGLGRLENAIPAGPVSIAV